MTTVDVSSANSKKIRTGSLLLGLLGVSCLILARLAHGGVRVTFLVIAALCLVPAVLPFVFAKTFFRQRRLEVSADGVRWLDPAGSWFVEWSELRNLAVATAGPRQVRNAQTQTVSAYSGTVYVDLTPSTDHFAGNHPELEPLWSGSSYRLPLGPNDELIPTLDAAFREHAAEGCYLGVVPTG